MSRRCSAILVVCMMAFPCLRLNADEPAEAVQRIIPLLDDPEPPLRRYAAEMLAEIGPAAEASIPQLLGALRDKNKTVAARAADALRKIGFKPVIESLNVGARVDLGVIEQDDRGDDVFTPILTGIRISKLSPYRYPNGQCRRQAVVTSIISCQQRQSLMKALQSNPKTTVRLSAEIEDPVVIGDPAIICIVRDLEERDTVDEFITALKDERDAVRQYAVETFGLLGTWSEPVIEALNEATRDQNAAVRSAANKAIKAIEADHVEPTPTGNRAIKAIKAKPAGIVVSPPAILAPDPVPPPPR